MVDQALNAGDLRARHRSNDHDVRSGTFAAQPPSGARLAPERLVESWSALRACQPRPRAEKIRMPLQHALGKRTVARAAERLVDHGEGAGQDAWRARSLRSLPPLQLRPPIAIHSFTAGFPSSH